MITLNIRVDVDLTTWGKVTADECELLKSIISKLGGEGTIHSADEAIIMERLSHRISDFPLSTRARNVLVRNGIETLGDLLGKNCKELLHIQNLGRGTLKEIQHFLAEQGLTLRTRRTGNCLTKKVRASSRS